MGLTRTCCLHIADGLNGWSMGIQNLLQMIFGTPLLDIVGLEAKLLSERSKYLVAELKEASGEEGKLFYYFFHYYLLGFGVSILTNRYILIGIF